MQFWKWLRNFTKLETTKQDFVGKVVIRAVTDNDANAIAQLRKAADKDRQNRNPPLDPYGGEYPKIDQQKSEIQEFGQSDLFLLAEIEREVVGIVFAFEMHPMSGDYRLNVVVARDWRKNGIGSALVSRIVSRLKAEPSARSVVCAFQKSHQDAKRLFEKLGFSVHKQGMAWYMQGGMYNEVEMGLILNGKE